MTPTDTLPTTLPKENRPNRVEKGVVTFVDILGWQGIYQIREEPLKDIHRIIDGLKDEKEKLRGSTDPPGDYFIISISDTIVIASFCQFDNVTGVLENHGKLGKWILEEALRRNLPLRGATSYGEYKIKGNVLVGKAVDEAASWYEQGEWIGINMTPSATFVFDSPNSESNWIEYSPTFKKNKWKTYCIKWNLPISKESIKELKLKFSQMGPITSSISSKYTNTLKFMKKLRELQDQN